MNWLRDFLDWTHVSITTPESYGTFHFAFLIGTIFAAIILGVLILKFQKKDNLLINKIVFAFGVMFLLLEIYKQLYFTYVLHSGTYVWYIFPFQFCSVPLYLCLITPLIKHKKLQNSLYVFLAFWTLLGGIMVMLIPNDVFINNLGISLQTMLWHGGMIVVATSIIVAKGYGKSMREYLGGLQVFGFLALFALLLNITFYNLLGFSTTSVVFNMFFISPYYTTTLMVFNNIQTSFGYVPFLLTYLFAFSAGAFAIYMFVYGIRKLTARK